MSLVSLAGIVGPALFAGSFGYFIDDRAIVHLPGAPWYIAAMLLGIGVVLGWRYARQPARVAEAVAAASQAQP
jgi:DHA1 family tetracycline resistance protein-like MFS transporter